MADLQADLQRAAAAAEALLGARDEAADRAEGLQAALGGREGELAQAHAQLLQRDAEVARLQAESAAQRGELLAAQQGRAADKESMRDTETLLRLQFADMVKTGKIVVESQAPPTPVQDGPAEAPAGDGPETEAFAPRAGPSPKRFFADVVGAATRTEAHRQHHSDGDAERDALVQQQVRPTLGLALTLPSRRPPVTCLSLCPCKPLRTLG